MKYKAIRYLVAFLIIFGLFAWIFTNIFYYFVLSLIIASVLRPMVNYFSQTEIYGLRIPRYFGVVMAFGVLVGVVAIFIVLFIPVFSAQIETLSDVDYDEIVKRVSSPVMKIEDFMISNNLSGQEPGFLRESIKLNVVEFFRERNFALVNNLFAYTGQFLIGLIAVLFISFFVLYEDGLVRRKLISLIPNSFFEVTISAITKIESLLSNYLVGLLVQMLAIFTLASLGLTIMEIPFALTIALFAAVANFIPYLGPLMGTLFGIVVSASTTGVLGSPNDYFLLIVKLLVVFGIVQLTDNIVLQPLIFSKSVKAHPLEIFVVIFAGASIAGIIGMIAAIPVYTILRVMVVELYAGYNQYKIFKI